MSNLQGREYWEMERNNNKDAQVAALKSHYCNWLSVKKWESAFESDVYVHQNLVCQVCGKKQTISHKVEKTCDDEENEPAKCPCGEDATIVHGTKGLCCAECAKND